MLEAGLGCNAQDMARSERNLAPVHSKARLAALLGLAVVSGAAAGCLPDDVPPPSNARYEACELGYDCAQDCEFPLDELTELGCGPGDFTSEPPNCPLEDDCANAKSNCFMSCDEMFPTNMDGTRPPEQTECKKDCDDQFGNASTCKTDFQAWLDERDTILRSFDNCLSPCEGRPTIDDCTGPERADGCDETRKARHTGVQKAADCIASGEGCDWSCDDPITGFPDFAE